MTALFRPMFGLGLGILLSSCAGFYSSPAEPGFAANLRVDHASAEADRRADDARLFELEGEPFELVKLELTSRSDDGLQIPVYVFIPTSGQPEAALVWVYGGLHDRFGTNYIPFIREACARGYAVFVPEYRGAKGYGEDYYDAFDYGGGEVDDILAVGDYAASSYDFDASKIGVVGWSHGGLIAMLAAADDPGRFGALVVSVPVSNLLVRVVLNGPTYERLFEDLEDIGAPVHENPDPYVRRSPTFRVGDLSTPMHAQFATNDSEVPWVEAEGLALRLQALENAEVRIFEDPEFGHYFNRQVDLETLQRRDTPVQVESWNAIWEFLEGHLGVAPAAEEGEGG